MPFIPRRFVGTAAASKITSITKFAPEYIGVWSTGCDRALAPIRAAMKRCVFGLIMRSSSATDSTSVLFSMPAREPPLECTGLRLVVARRLRYLLARQRLCAQAHAEMHFSASIQIHGSRELSLAVPDSVRHDKRPPRLSRLHRARAPRYRREI